MRRFPLCLLGCLLLMGSTAHAAVSSSGDKQLESGSTTQGGGSSESASRKNQSTIGGAVANTQMSSSRFRFFSGILGASATPATPPPATDLDIPLLSASIEPGGSAIAASTWQRDSDPFFYWQPPATGPEVAGYSYAIDAAPDSVIDTQGTSFNVATSTLKSLSDGQHTFSVAAVNSGGNAGPAATFQLWVDTTPPQVTASAPAPGALLNTPALTVRATVSDAASGVDQATVALLINGLAAMSQFNAATGVLTATPAWAEGANRIELRASDILGNAQTPLIWSVTLDTLPPSGTVVINGGSAVTTSVYVTLSLAANDATTGVAGMLISNDLLGSYVEEAYAPLRPLWRLSPVRGTQTVCVKFVDGAGNISQPVSDAIDVALLSPDTLITGGPAGFAPAEQASFAFLCPEGGCVFSHAFDSDDWSQWSSATTAVKAQLSPGNHYFRVKAAKEANGIEGIQPDEEDPTPAERTWINGLEPSIMAVPVGSPIKLWRIE